MKTAPYSSEKARAHGPYSHVRHPVPKGSGWKKRQLGDPLDSLSKRAGSNMPPKDDSLLEKL
jgi:hypothetical protein